MQATTMLILSASTIVVSASAKSDVPRFRCARKCCKTMLKEGDEIFSCDHNDFYQKMTVKTLTGVKYPADIRLKPEHGEIIRKCMVDATMYCSRDCYLKNSGSGKAVTAKENQIESCKPQEVAIDNNDDIMTFPCCAKPICRGVDFRVHIQNTQYFLATVESVKGTQIYFTYHGLSRMDKGKIKIDKNRARQKYDLVKCVDCFSNNDATQVQRKSSMKNTRKSDRLQRCETIKRGLFEYCCGKKLRVGNEVYKLNKNNFCLNKLTSKNQRGKWCRRGAPCKCCAQKYLLMTVQKLETMSSGSVIIDLKWPNARPTMHYSSTEFMKCKNCYESNQHQQDSGIGIPSNGNSCQQQN